MKIRSRLGSTLLVTLTGVVISAAVAYSLIRERETALEVASSETQNITRMLEEHARQSLRLISAAIVAADAAAAGTGRGCWGPQTTGVPPRQLLPPDRNIHSFSVFDQSGATLFSTSAEPSNGDASRAARDHDYFFRTSEVLTVIWCSGHPKPFRTTAGGCCRSAGE